jgi:hypothetical protein
MDVCLVERDDASCKKNVRFKGNIEKVLVVARASSRAPDCPNLYPWIERNQSIQQYLL